MTEPSTGGEGFRLSALPAPGEPFLVHRFDPAAGDSRCATWRTVTGGERQFCPYAQADPVHLDQPAPDAGTGP